MGARQDSLGVQDADGARASERPLVREFDDDVFESCTIALVEFEQTHARQTRQQPLVLDDIARDCARPAPRRHRGWPAPSPRAFH